MLNDVHVYPLNDLAPHILEDERCPCKPTIKVVEGGRIIIHNSWDGREEIEYLNEAKGKIIQ